jgi:Ca-activated chloride channel homolog
MDMIRFANGEWAILLILIPKLIFFYWYVFRAKRTALDRFGSAPLMEIMTRSTSRRRQLIKTALIIGGVSLLVVAILRPQIGTRLEEVKREGQDIVIALDVSRSMLAEDIKPNRLEKAKKEIAGIIDRLDGDRIGLVAFAGNAFVQCPLTLDYGAAKIFLDIMDPSIIPTPGTAVGDAIETSMKAFEQEERKHKVLLLITDGEDHKANAEEKAAEAAQQGIVIYTVGIGSGEGVPVPSAQGGQGGFVKDRGGQVVLSKLDEVLLEKIALETNGKYYRASPGGAELDAIYEAIAGMEKKELASMQFSQYEERFQYFVGLALLLLCVELIISDRHSIKHAWHGRFKD